MVMKVTNIACGTVLISFVAKRLYSDVKTIRKGPYVYNTSFNDLKSTRLHMILQSNNQFIGTGAVK